MFSGEWLIKMGRPADRWVALSISWFWFLFQYDIIQKSARLALISFHQSQWLAVKKGWSVQVVRVRNRLDPKVIEEYNLREDLTGNECAEGCVYSKKGFKFPFFWNFVVQSLVMQQWSSRTPWPPSPFLTVKSTDYVLLRHWEPLESIRALSKLVMGGKYIDQIRGGSLIWSIFFSFDSPRQNSDRGSSKQCEFPQFLPGGM